MEQLRRITLDLETYTRRRFSVARKNAGFLGLGCEIVMTLDGERILTEVVYGDTLHAIGRYSRALLDGDIEKIEKANNMLPKRFQQPIIVNGK
jgi:hypothetical protein